VESEIFSDMFQLPTPTVDGHALDGSSDDQPLRLDGIKKSDFLQLLRVMFPSWVIYVHLITVSTLIHVPRDSQQPESLTLEEWTSVLKLSTMWQFHKIRAAAIKNMEGFSMDLVDKILIARRFDISTWLVPTLNALVQREKPIDLSEGNRLGIEWVLKVAEVRECDVFSHQLRSCPHCSYKGAARCHSCNSTLADRCGSCNRYLTSLSNVEKRGGKSDIDFSNNIREVFGVV